MASFASSATTCGTRKHAWTNLYFAVRGVTTAAQLVEFCKSQPQFKEVHQAKYLAATTTRRSYIHLTQEDVEDKTTARLLKDTLVEQFPGNTSS